MNYRYLLFLVMAIVYNRTVAQPVSDGVGIGTITPHASAILDIQPPSNNKGVLIPRLTTAQMDAISPAAASSLLVYNSTVNNFYFYDGTGWQMVGTPKGAIIMWSGSTSNIPRGWVLCNGDRYLPDGSVTTNPGLGVATPDLQERFIVGAGSRDNGTVAGTSQYAPGANGGLNSVTLGPSQIPFHNHPASSSSAGSHSHTFSYTGASGKVVGKNSGGGEDGADDAALSSTTNAGGAHTHTITVSNNTVGGGSHENRPPYYALAFIMKL